LRIEVENRSDEFVGLRLALRPEDAQNLMRLLSKMVSSEAQHFHLTADTSSSFVDIEISMQGADEQTNAALTGFPITWDANTKE